MVIRGMGFSKFAEELEVFVGGKPCAVLSSDVDVIVCVTSARYDESQSSEAYTVYANKSVIASPRDAGSPGWWIKMWTSSGDSSSDDDIALEFGLRDKFYLSMYDSYGSQWPSSIGFDTYYFRYTADAGSIFTAPYAGYYTFYVSSDDQSWLYASSEGIGKNEILLAKDSSYSMLSNRYFRNRNDQMSLPVPLAKGERLFLRVRTVSIPYIKTYNSLSNCYYAY